MKDFRDELLEYLFQHSGETVDVLFIVKKWVDVNYDGICTQEDINKLLDINVVLRELERMDWISCYPKGGMMTGSTGVPTDPNKRQLLGGIALRARMTTHGEIEYKKLKKEEQQTSSVTNIQNIGVNNGIAAQDSVLSDSDFRPLENPIAQPNQSIPKNKIIAAINWTWDIITKHPLISGVIGTVIAGYIIWKLGWN